jgi:hypothetical protein
MDSIRNRAKKRFPTVLLTLLSIVQALALEFLWGHSRHRPELYEATSGALIGWLQIAATLNVIILIWLAYASMVMRFRWTPTTADSVWPFNGGQGRTNRSSRLDDERSEVARRVRIGLCRSESIEPPTRGFSVASRIADGFVFQ